jgi:hypothetical protein
MKFELAQEFPEFRYISSMTVRLMKGYPFIGLSVKGS